MENERLPLAVTIDDTVNFKGKLLDENINPISNAIVVITVNNESFNAQTDANGFYSLEYTPSKVANNNIYEIKYQGNEVYDLARNYIGSYFDVEEVSTILTTNSEINIDDLVYIYGELKNENNKKLADVNISIFVDSEEFSTLTDERGFYNYTYKFENPGKKVAIIRVNDGKHEVSTKIEFDIPKYVPKMLIEPVEVDVSEKTLLKATFDSSNITEGRVNFRINGKTLRYDNGSVIYVPIVDGTASLNYQFDINQVRQGLTISAMYSGSDEFYSSSCVLPDVTYVIPEPVVSIDNITAKAEDTIILKQT